jgi:predicted Zn-dependent protease
MRSIPAIWWIIPIVAIFQSPAVAQEDLFLLYTAGAFEKVIDQASVEIESGKASGDEYYLKSLAELQLGRPEQSLRTLEMGVASMPGDRRLVRMKAEQHFDLDDYAGAWSQYEILVRSDSSDLASWLKLAEISMNRQHFHRTVLLLDQLLSPDSVNP